MNPLSRRLLAILATLLVMVWAFPIFAQDTETADYLIVTGAIHFDTTTGDITVNEYTIAPSNAFIPADFNEGDMVIVTGQLLPDGITIEADSIEAFDAEVEEDTSTSTGTDTTGDTTENSNQAGGGRGNANGSNGGNGGRGNGGQGNGNGGNGNGGQGNGNANGGNANANSHGLGHSNEERGSNREAACERQSERQHPMASRLADEFGVSEEVIMSLFCDGYGFGEIALLFAIDENSDASYTDIVALRESGMGWGEIMEEYEIDPSQMSISRNAGLGNGNGRGNANGNANGNGNGN